MDDKPEQKTFTIEVTTAELAAISMAMASAKPLLYAMDLFEAGHTLLHKVAKAVGLPESELACPHTARAKEEWPTIIKEESVS